MLRSVAIAASLLPIAAHGQPIEAVAWGDGPIAGLPAGVTVSRLLEVRPNAAGEAVVVAEISGPGVTPSDNDVLLLASGGSFRLLVREGETLPGLPAGSTLRRPRTGTGYALTEVGVAALLLASDTPSGVSLGYWATTGAGGALELVIRDGDQAPGFDPGVAFRTDGSGFAFPGPGDAFTFVSDLDHPALGLLQNPVVWRSSGGVLSTPLRAGDAEPALAPDAVYERFTFGLPIFNGFTAWGGTVESSQLPANQRTALLWETFNGVSVLLQTGVPAPGFAPGENVSLLGVGFPVLAGNSNVGTLATFTSDSGIGRALYGRQAMGMTLIAAEGQTAPETGGAAFVNLFANATAPNGRAAFTAALNTFSTGIWSDVGGSLRLIAQQGVTIPGGPASTRYDDLLDATLAIDSNSRVGFSAPTAGSPSAGSGLFRAPENGPTVTLLTTGREVNVGGPGAADFRTVSGIAVSLPPSNPSFTYAGEFVVGLAFDDGSCGVFRISDPVPARCVADATTTNTNPGDAGFGQPDGEIDGADLSYFVEAWLNGDAALADVNTTNTNPGDASYGIPDGSVDGADLSFFIEAWLSSCT